MTNPSTIAQTKRTRSKADQPPVWRFEIIDESSGATPWSELGQSLSPFVEAARDALGDLYVSIAKVVLEWKEDFEDQRAERKARRLIAGPARVADRAPQKHRSELGASLRNRVTSISKFRA